MSGSVPYLTTASGQRYRLAGPELDTPRIGDIAHHLAQINRFTGAASRPYSVAEHSLLCEQIAASEGAGPMARLCALMHDAHEAYTSDMASPVKIALRIEDDVEHGSGYDYLEAHHQMNVLNSFNMGQSWGLHRHDVRRWDLMALKIERAALMPIDGDTWPILEGVATFEGYDFRRAAIWPWDHWRDCFFEKYRGLLAL